MILFHLAIIRKGTYNKEKQLLKKKKLTIARNSF